MSLIVILHTQAALIVLVGGTLPLAGKLCVEYHVQYCSLPEWLSFVRLGGMRTSKYGDVSKV